jgi:DNA-binding transcriptional ArsR family regulator
MQKPRSVSEIVAACREEQSKVSHALSILLLCNLVRISKKGRMHIYEIANSKIKQILKLVDKEFCSACKNPCAQHARKQSLRNRLNPKKE